MDLKFKKDFVLLGSSVSPKFHEFAVQTSLKEIEKMKRITEKQSLEECKQLWSSVLHELTVYTPDELKNHYDKNDKVWKNWCDDCLIWNCLNKRVFNKDIKMIPLQDIDAYDETRIE